MRKNNVLIVIMVLVLMLSLIALPACNRREGNTNGETRVVVDSVGREVEVPKDPQAICTLSAFAGPLVCLYGFSDRMPATCNNVLRDTFLKQLCPALNYSINVKNSGTMNAESIMALNVDVIFLDKDMYSDPDEKKKLDTMRIPYVVVDYVGMDAQIEAAMVVGKALGCEDIAQKYVDFYRTAINTVSSNITSITDRKVYTIYHSINEATRTDSAGDLGAEWIGVTGCKNVSIDSELNIEDGKSMANLETILSWDPEVIICNEPGVDDAILADKTWSGVNAVKNNRVYQIPIGITRYGHPNGIETALAIYWLGTKLYPEAFDFTIEQKMKEFYYTFFNVEVSDETIAQIIQGDGIRTEKNKNS